MIRIVLGNVGSGKTATMVRELIKNDSGRVTYSNIKTPHIKNNVEITREMLVKTEQIGMRKNGEPIIKYSFNADFWKDAIKKHGAINVVIDEAHTVLSSRTSMSKQNRIMTDFLALLRRILGSNDAGHGELTLITQLDRRLDVIAREMATQVRFNVCHFRKRCKSCGHSWTENNEVPEQQYLCTACGSAKIIKCDHVIEVWHFPNMTAYQAWREFGDKRYHRHYFVTDIEKYFKFYDTYQWESLLSEL